MLKIEETQIANISKELLERRADTIAFRLSKLNAFSNHEIETLKAFAADAVALGDELEIKKLENQLVIATYLARSDHYNLEELINLSREAIVPSSLDSEKSKLFLLYKMLVD